MMRSVFLAQLIALFCVLGTGCERTPESLEDWRNAEGGFQKMSEWAMSPEESESVRIRALQILIEEGQTPRIAPTLEGVKDAAIREKIATGAVPTVEQMWAKKDWPTVDKSAANEAGLIKIEGESQSIIAKDAAYQLQPFTKGESRERLEAILAEWMSQDQDVRNQLGDTTLAQIAPRAGTKGIPMMLAWLESTNQPAVVVEKIMMANSGDDANQQVSDALATSVLKRLEAEHPEISEQTKLSLLRLTSPKLAPYLERAIEDTASPPSLIDTAMMVYNRSMGEKATPLYAKLVAERDGNLRWVAALNLVELRGKSGVLAGAKALPLEPDTYATPKKDSFKDETEKYCRIAKGELEAQGVDSMEPTVELLLKSERWPAQVLGIRCAQETKAKGLIDAVKALQKEKQAIPGWGEKKSVGALATEVAAELEG